MTTTGSELGERQTSLKVTLVTVMLALAGCVDNPDPYFFGELADVEAFDVAAVDAGPDADLSDTAERPDAGVDAADAAQPELRADPGPRVYGQIDEIVLLDASASTAAVEYQWNFGDGEGQQAPTDDPTVSHSYAAPGRYEAVLTVFDASGGRDTASTVVTITHPAVFNPGRSTTVTAFTRNRAAVVSPDSNELMFARKDLRGWEVEARIATDRKPRTVTSWQQWLVVPCEEDATLLFFRKTATGETRRVFLPFASRPYGVTAMDDQLFVTLRATGEVVRVEFEGGIPRVTKTVEVIDDPRGIAVLPDGRLLVSRWRSPGDGGRIAVVSRDLDAVETWTLQVEPRAASDTEIGGVPTYLGAVAVSPTGREAAIPSLQANIAAGEFRSGEPMTHDTTVRAVASFIDLATETEAFDRRKQWDHRGFANDAVFSSHGDLLYVAMRGNRAVERYDVLAATQTRTLPEVGHAIEGLALTPDDRFLLVDASLSRELVIYDTEELGSDPEPVARLKIPTDDPLDPELLRGKILFNDAEDPRITKDGYIACAHCHLDGESDRRVWDFTDRGEGLRNTPSLLGRAGMGHGPVHWSGSFDEIQDFENDIRFSFAGTGLMEDVDFNAGTRSEPLGDPKAGLSDDLDALAAFVSSFDRHLPSPHRRDDRELTALALQGQAIFMARGCDGCHTPPDYTDSAFMAPGTPLLHDVGTITAASGQRLGAPLEGIDTPTLRGIWNSPPYLHDGSAPTLRDVVTTANSDDEHGTTSTLTPAELDALVAFLRSLDPR